MALLRTQRHSTPVCAKNYCAFGVRRSSSSEKPIHLWLQGGTRCPQRVGKITAPLALNRCAPEAHGPNQSPPLKPAQPKNTEQPTRDRRRLRNDHPIYLNVID